MLLHSSLYVAMGAGLIVWLSLHVIGYRHREHISIGDGDREDLRRAMSAQSNAVEYIPIGLLLLLCYELAGGNIWLVHIGGLSFIAGRLVHAYGFLNEQPETRDFTLRVRGMQLTLYAIIFLIVLNLLRFLVVLLGMSNSLFI